MVSSLPREFSALPRHISPAVFFVTLFGSPWLAPWWMFFFMGTMCFILTYCHFQSQDTSRMMIGFVFCILIALGSLIYGLIMGIRNLRLIYCGTLVAAKIINIEPVHPRNNKFLFKITYEYLINRMLYEVTQQTFHLSSEILHDGLHLFSGSHQQPSLQGSVPQEFYASVLYLPNQPEVAIVLADLDSYMVIDEQGGVHANPRCWLNWILPLLIIGIAVIGALLIFAPSVLPFSLPFLYRV